MMQLILVCSLGLFAAGPLPDDYQLPPPPGPYARRSAEPAQLGPGFRAGEPTVATTYFYWYDNTTNAHLIDPDGTDALTDHPPTLKGFSYRNVAWHRQQLLDMIAAGIDVVMPVYWGVPGEHRSWSNEGLPPLVAARQQLIDQGQKPPAIGMFYDTTTLQHNGRYHVDLRTPAGQRWFYGTIRDFLSLIPPQHRARIGGRPLVFLYSVHFAKGVDQRLFPAVRAMSRQELGTDLFLVKPFGWPGQANGVYRWGGAIRPWYLSVAAFGPGYDHSAVPGRQPLIRPRENGAFYTRNWQALLARPVDRRPWLVHLETWNEFHEGTEICHSAEYGRQYIELTRRFADLFHARQQVPVDLPDELIATPRHSAGLTLVEHPDGDGRVVRKTVGGRLAWSTAPTARSPHGRYLYFDVDDRFAVSPDDQVLVTVRYFDQGPAGFQLQYDSADPALNGKRAQAFRTARNQKLSGTRRWRETLFTLRWPLFAGRAHDADFRLGCVGKDLAVSEIRLRRAGKGR